MFYRFLMLVICGLSLSACVTPTYQDHSQKTSAQAEMNSKDVNFKISGLYYRDPPECVVVMETKTDKQPAMARMISIALARHLGEKIDRVIFPRKRVYIAKKQGYDLSNKQDLRRFSQFSKCRFYVNAELYDLGDEFAVVFSEKHVGIKIDMMRFEDDEPVWQAAHTVWRADGGMPLSPMGALGGIASAAMFSSDTEILPSLVDDAMRRMVRTLPPDMMLDR